jgi:serine/threonine protein kinase
MAEPEHPVKRMVALKIIKLGMDTRQVVARFEAERQALALMDHPGVAKVLDGGATETGRPYFVMELVKGTPITDYCDKRKLNIRQRLELFAQVCQAVQHAHQKGLIHRDIKPSKVMVSTRDDRPEIIRAEDSQHTAEQAKLDTEIELQRARLLQVQLELATGDMTKARSLVLQPVHPSLAQEWHGGQPRITTRGFQRSDGTRCWDKKRCPGPFKTTTSGDLFGLMT